MILENLNGITIKELKDYIKNLPDKDENGEDYEVWIESGRNLSSPAKLISPLNEGDILIQILC